MKTNDTSTGLLFYPNAGNKKRNPFSFQRKNHFPDIDNRDKHIDATESLIVMFRGTVISETMQSFRLEL